MRGIQEARKAEIDELLETVEYVGNVDDDWTPPPDEDDDDEEPVGKANPYHDEKGRFTSQGQAVKFGPKHPPPPQGLHGVAFSKAVMPGTLEEWKHVPGQGSFKEPPLPKTEDRWAAGVVIAEPDGRVWIVEPTNHFGGYRHTFPKGSVEPGLNLRQTAIKEAYEETGLQVELTSYLGDFQRDTSVGRYYLARRVGGDPSDFGWETHQTKLVPREDLKRYLNRSNDQNIASYLDSMLDDTTGEAEAPTIPSLTAKSVMKEKLAGAGGSNPGGVYKGADGKIRYVKQYSDPAQAHGEHLANQLYQDLGLGAPKSVVLDGEDGKPVYASRMLIRPQTLQTKGLTPKRANEILDGFAADVLTGNWDAVGLAYDNIVYDAFEGDRPIRIDNGGTFLMRAQAGRKPPHLLNEITELEGFSSPSVNPQYAKVFQTAGVKSPAALGERLTAQIQDLTTLRNQYGGWKAYVESKAPGLQGSDKTAIVTMLEERHKKLEMWGEKVLPVIKLWTLVEKYNKNHYPAGTPGGKGGQFAPAGVDMGSLPAIPQGLIVPWSEGLGSSAKSLNKKMAAVVSAFSAPDPVKALKTITPLSEKHNTGKKFNAFLNEAQSLAKDMAAAKAATKPAEPPPVSSTTDGFALASPSDAEFKGTGGRPTVESHPLVTHPIHGVEYPFKGSALTAKGKLTLAQLQDAAMLDDLDKLISIPATGALADYKEKLVNAVTSQVDQDELDTDSYTEEEYDEDDSLLGEEEAESEPSAVLSAQDIAELKPFLDKAGLHIPGDADFTPDEWFQIKTGVGVLSDPEAHGVEVANWKKALLDLGLEEKVQFTSTSSLPNAAALNSWLKANGIGPELSSMAQKAQKLGIGIDLEWLQKTEGHPYKAQAAKGYEKLFDDAVSKDPAVRETAMDMLGQYHSHIDLTNFRPPKTVPKSEFADLGQPIPSVPKHLTPNAAKKLSFEEIAYYGATKGFPLDPKKLAKVDTAHGGDEDLTAHFKAELVSQLNAAFSGEEDPYGSAGEVDWDALNEFKLDEPTQDTEKFPHTTAGVQLRTGLKATNAITVALANAHGIHVSVDWVKEKNEYWPSEKHIDDMYTMLHSDVVDAIDGNMDKVAELRDGWGFDTSGIEAVLSEPKITEPTTPPVSASVPVAPHMEGKHAVANWNNKTTKLLTEALAAADPVTAVANVPISDKHHSTVKEYKKQLLAYLGATGVKEAEYKPTGSWKATPAGQAAKAVSSKLPQKPPIPDPPALDPKYPADAQELFKKKIAALQQAYHSNDPETALSNIPGASKAISGYKAKLISTIDQWKQSLPPEAIKHQVGAVLAQWKVIATKKLNSSAFTEHKKFKPDDLISHYHLRKSLPKEERQALTNFQDGNTYRGELVQAYLQGYTVNSPSIANLDAAVKKAPIPRDALFVRNIDSTLLAAKAYSLVGTVVEDPGYLNASLDGDAFKTRNVRIFLNAPKGTPAFHVAKGSSYEKEQEVIMPRNTRFLVNKVTKGDYGKTFIYATILPPKDQKGWP